MGVEHISFYLLLRYIYDVCIIFVLVRFKNDDGRNTGGWRCCADAAMQDLKWSIYLHTHTHTLAAVNIILARARTCASNNSNNNNNHNKQRRQTQRATASKIELHSTEQQSNKNRFFFSSYLYCTYYMYIRRIYIYIYTMQANTTLLVVSVTLSMSWLADCRLYFYFLVFRITWWFLPRDIRGIIIGRRIVLAKQRTRNERRQYHSMQQWANVGWAMRSAECPVRKLWLCVLCVCRILIVVLLLFCSYSFFILFCFPFYLQLIFFFILYWCDRSFPYVRIEMIVFGVMGNL